MARLGEKLLDLVFYLYPNRAAAELGQGAGGTGFIVAIPSEVVDTVLYLYAVTNRHVIEAAKDDPDEPPYIRLNARDGKWRCGPVPKHLWACHPNLDDVAVLSMKLGDISDLAINWMRIDHFATKEALEEYEIGPGDAVCMIGRFVNHEGIEKNLPSVRFGNISKMPWEPIKHEWGHLQESYLVECRSLPGFSGSPVIVYHERLQIGFTRKNTLSRALLLGIDWCHPPNWRPVEEWDANQNRWVRRADMRVDTNSGMAGVIPAWKIKEILDGEPFMSERKASEENLREIKKGAAEVSSVDMATADAQSLAIEEPET